MVEVVGVAVAVEVVYRMYRSKSGAIIEITRGVVAVVEVIGGIEVVGNVVWGDLRLIVIETRRNSVLVPVVIIVAAHVLIIKRRIEVLLDPLVDFIIRAMESLSLAHILQVLIGRGIFPFALSVSGRFSILWRK